MVFYVKKFLNIDVGLTLWRKGGKNQCEPNEQHI
jgi:hypothetical protein